MSLVPVCNRCDRDLIKDAVGSWLCIFCDSKEKPFPIEVNGPANIVMLIDVAQKLGQPVNLEAIRAEAVRTIRYLEALGRGERPKWHTIKEQA